MLILKRISSWNLWIHAILILSFIYSSSLISPKVSLIRCVHLWYQVLILMEVPWIFVMIDARIEVAATLARITVLLHYSVGIKERVHGGYPFIIVLLWVVIINRSGCSYWFNLELIMLLLWVEHIRMLLAKLHRGVSLWEVTFTDRFKSLQRATLGHRIKHLTLHVLSMHKTSDVLFLLFEESLAILVEHLIDLLPVHALWDFRLAMEVVLIYCPVWIDTSEHANTYMSPLNRFFSKSLWVIQVIILLNSLKSGLNACASTVLFLII